MSIATLLAGVIEALRDETGPQGLTLDADIDQRDLRVTGDPAVLRPLIAELCRNEVERAQRGQRIRLRAERHDNHAWISVLGMGRESAELSQAAAAHLGQILSAAGGTFTPMGWQGRFTYVVTLPLHPLAASGSDAVPVARAGADGEAHRWKGCWFSRSTIRKMHAMHSKRS